MWLLSFPKCFGTDPGEGELLSCPISTDDDRLRRQRLETWKWDYTQHSCTADADNLCLYQGGAVSLAHPFSSNCKCRPLVTGRGHGRAIINSLTSLIGVLVVWTGPCPCYDMHQGACGMARVWAWVRVRYHMPMFNSVPMQSIYSTSFPLVSSRSNPAPRKCYFPGSHPS